MRTCGTLSCPISARIGVYDRINKALQDLIAPGLHAMRGDMRVLAQKIDQVDQKIDSLRTKTVSLEVG